MAAAPVEKGKLMHDEWFNIQHGGSSKGSLLQLCQQNANHGDWFSWRAEHGCGWREKPSP